MVGPAALEPARLCNIRPPPPPADDDDGGDHDQRHRRQQCGERESVRSSARVITVACGGPGEFGGARCQRARQTARPPAPANRTKEGPRARAKQLARPMTSEIVGLARMADKAPLR